MANVTTDIKLIVRAEIDKAIQEIRKQNKELDNLGNKAGSITKKFSALKGAFTSVIGALAIREVATVTTDLAKLATEAANVKAAFDKLPDSTNLFKTLKSNVKGAVPDLELMRAAIIGLDLGATNQQLDTFSKFARLESVRKGSDTLETFNNILSGVLRGSTELLDNFGINLTELNRQIEILAVEKLGKAATGLSAVERRTLSVDAAAKIMNTRLTAQGEIALTDAEKIAQMNAEFENAQVAIGAIISGPVISSFSAIGGVVSSLTKDVTDQVEEFVQLRDKTNSAESEISALLNTYVRLKAVQKPSTEQQKKLNNAIQAIAERVPGAVTSIDQYGNALDINAGKVKNFINQQRELLKRTQADVFESLKDEINSTAAVIAVAQKQIESGRGFRGRQGIIQLTNEQLEEQRQKAREASESMDGLVLALGNFIDLETVAGTKLSKELDISVQQADLLIDRFKKLNEAPAPSTITPPVPGSGSTKKDTLDDELKFYNERAKLIGDAYRREADEILQSYQDRYDKQKELDTEQVEFVRQIGEKELSEGIAVADYLLEHWQFTEEKRRELIELRADLEKQANEQQLQQAQFYADALSDVLAQPIARVTDQWISGMNKNKITLKNFLKDVQRQLGSFLASQVFKIFENFFLNLFSGGSASVLTGTIFAGAQTGEYIPGSSSGTIRKVGENNTPEVIIPVEKIGDFLAGKYNFPGGKGVKNIPGLMQQLSTPQLVSNPPFMAAGPGLSNTNNSTKIIERTESANGTVVVEVKQIPIPQNEVAAYFRDVNRNINRPDNDYQDAFLRTNNGEFDNNL